MESATAGTQRVQSRFKDLPLEEVPCLLCGRTDGRILVHDEPFLVRRCAGCGLGYTSPRIDGSRIHEIYDHSYWNSDSAKDFGYTSYEQDVEGYRQTFRLKLRALRGHVPADGTLLELGCAAGYFLEAAMERGYTPTGVDVSESILATARERLGPIDLHAGLVEELDLPLEHYGIIAMWDVIEHVSDPFSVLRRCRELLAADGRLVLQTQDVSSLTRKLLGSKWHHFKQLEHIYHFSPATIATLLERSGYEVVHWTRRRSGKYVSFHFLAERAKRFGKIPGLLAAPLDLLGRRFLYINPFDEMIVVARKKD